MCYISSRLRLALVSLLLLASSLLIVGCGEEDIGTPIFPSGVRTANAATTQNPGASHKHIVVIDPGHGGSDSGTVHGSQDNPDLMEKDLTLRIGTRTAALLREAGYTVVLTRTKDQLVNTPATDLNGDGSIDIYDDLQARVDAANTANADLFLSIHINGSELGNAANGAETWYCADRPFKDKSELFARLVQQETVKSIKAATGYDLQDRGYHNDLDLDPNNHIFVLGPPDTVHSRATQMPGVLTESMFITDDTESGLLREDNTIDTLARAYTSAIKEYYTQIGG